MDIKRITKSSTKVIVNKETGEVLDSEIVTTSVVNKEPNFVKLYVKDIGKLLNLTKSDTSVLFCILGIIGYDNIFYAMVNTKTKIMEDIGTPMNTVNDSIRNLNNAGILIRQGKGVYLVNPELFARGSWKDVVKIRLKIQYTQEGRTIEQVDIDTLDLTETETI